MLGEERRGELEKRKEVSLSWAGRVSSQAGDDDGECYASKSQKECLALTGSRDESESESLDR